jgi:hypothetical protein
LQNTISWRLVSVCNNRYRFAISSSYYRKLEARSTWEVLTVRRKVEGIIDVTLHGHI